MLTVEHLSYRYRSGPQVLRDVGFSLEDGQFMAILGNNGVGKSTMLKCFNRILTPDSGSVQADGEELLRLPGREIAKRMAFVAQSVPATQMTVHDMVMLGRRPYMKWGFLVQETDWLLLDEPTSSLDIQNQYQVLRIVRDICHDQGITAIVVIHDLNLALRFCDRFLLLRQGQVYRWGGREILDRQALWEVYGVRAQVAEVNGQSIVLMDE